MNRPNELYHHGILGQKWGVRRYQNPDGTLTSAGKSHYDNYSPRKMDIDDRKAAIRGAHAIGYGLSGAAAAGILSKAREPVHKFVESANGNMFNYDVLTGTTKRGYDIVTGNAWNKGTVIAGIAALALGAAATRAATAAGRRKVKQLEHITDKDYNEVYKRYAKYDR